MELNTESIFTLALGLQEPWYITNVDFEAEKKLLNISIDFRKGSKFSHSDTEGKYTAYDTEIKKYRHLNFFQHECILSVRVPRIKLPNGSIKIINPEWVGKVHGFTLLFEALVLAFCKKMTFTAVAKLLNISIHHVMTICDKYVNEALQNADFSDVTSIAVDETSRAKGHDYITIIADAEKRSVIYVTEGRDSETIKSFVSDFGYHKGNPKKIKSVSIDMSPAFIKGVTNNLPNARITFDKFHVIKHASEAIDKQRRIEQKSNPNLKGMRWALLKNQENLRQSERNNLHALISNQRLSRTARAWSYREQLEDILQCKQINVTRNLLSKWCNNVIRSKVEPMKEVAKMIKNHFEGIIAWAQTRLTNGFLEAINGIFQPAKRSARGFTRLSTIKTIIFLRPGKLDLLKVNPYLQHLPT